MIAPSLSKQGFKSPTFVGSILALLGRPSDLRKVIPEGEERKHEKHLVALGINLLGLVLCVVGSVIWVMSGNFSYGDDKVGDESLIERRRLTHQNPTSSSTLLE